jgi:hypothetical protein
MGDRVSLQKAAEAVKAFAELWPVGDFDCGPQEYDCMVKELMQEIPAAAQKVAKRKTVKCPSCGEQTHIGIAGVFEQVHIARTECEHCRIEFLIVDDVPMTREQYEKRN